MIINEIAQNVYRYKDLDIQFKPKRWDHKTWKETYLKEISFRDIHSDLQSAKTFQDLKTRSTLQQERLSSLWALQSRQKSFNKKIDALFDKGCYGTLKNKLDYRFMLKMYIAITCFLDNPNRQFLFMTFHWKPCNPINAQKTLRDFLNHVDRKIYGSQQRNGKKWLATIPIIEGKTPKTKHYHILIEKPEGCQVEEAIKAVWAKRKRKWCFLEDVPHFEGYRDRDAVLDPTSTVSAGSAPVTD